MFCYMMTAFTALLFVVLTPGVLLTLPSKTSDKIVVALVHGLVFVLFYNLTYNVVLNWTRKYEGFQQTMLCEEFDDNDECIKWVAEGFKSQKLDCKGATTATLVAANKAVGACAPGKGAVATSPFAKKVTAAAKKVTAAAKKPIAKPVTPAQKLALANKMNKAYQNKIKMDKKIIDTQAAELKKLNALLAAPRM